MSFELNPIYEEEGRSELPKDAIESVSEYDISAPQTLRGPLAERLSMLGTEQYKILLHEVFETSGITGEAIEAVVDENEATDIFHAVVAYVQAGTKEKESVKEQLVVLLPIESLA